MQEFNTVEEKSGEWNVTPRHIQYLCRTGKIQGALKRAGSWFIPGNAPSPVQNTKAGAEVFNFAGTKSKVFDCAIQLFMLRGYNDVSLRDIASCAGIRQSTIYNHFSSKQEILDTIYDFYIYYHQKDRPNVEQIEHMLHHGTPLEIIQCIRYDFKDEYKQKMSDITKIIFQRIAVDERAREINKVLTLENGIRYVEEVFERGVEIGRFAPFDIHAMAVLINSVRIFTLYSWVTDGSMENIIKFSTDEQAILKYAAEMIKDLKPKGEDVAAK